MHADTHLSHKYAYTYMLMHNAYLYIYTYIYVYTYIHITRLSYIYIHLYVQTYIPSFVRAAIPAHVHTRSCACASAVLPRTTARAAPTTRRARPACGGRAARAKKAAHTAYNVVTLTVFHAPMFALNADAE